MLLVVDGGGGGGGVKESQKIEWHITRKAQKVVYV